MPFTDHFDADDAAHLVDDLGERVVYVKRSVVPEELREIDAIVRRQSNRFHKRAKGNEVILAQPIRILIAKHATAGITAEEIDIGVDRFRLQTSAGDPSSVADLPIHMPENEESQNDPNFHIYELY